MGGRARRCRRVGGGTEGRREGEQGEGREEEMQGGEWGEGQRADGRGRGRGEKLPLDTEQVSIWQESAKGDHWLCFFFLFI